MSVHLAILAAPLILSAGRRQEKMSRVTWHISSPITINIITYFNPCAERVETLQRFCAISHIVLNRIHSNNTGCNTMCAARVCWAGSKNTKYLCYLLAIWPGHKFHFQDGLNNFSVRARLKTRMLRRLEIEIYGSFIYSLFCINLLYIIIFLTFLVGYAVVVDVCPCSRWRGQRSVSHCIYIVINGLVLQSSHQSIHPKATECAPTETNIDHSKRAPHHRQLGYAENLWDLKNRIPFWVRPVVRAVWLVVTSRNPHRRSSIECKWYTFSVLLLKTCSQCLRLYQVSRNLPLRRCVPSTTNS